jgi:hypothetical protein
MGRYLADAGITDEGDDAAHALGERTLFALASDEHRAQKGRHGPCTSGARRRVGRCSSPSSAGSAG